MSLPYDLMALCYNVISGFPLCLENLDNESHFSSQGNTGEFSIQPNIREKIWNKT